MLKQIQLGTILLNQKSDFYNSQMRQPLRTNKYW